MPDALGAKTLVELDRFQTWLNRGSAAGFIGEVGWGQNVDGTSWDAIGDLFYAALDRYGIGATATSTGEFQGEASTLTLYARGATGAPGVLTTVHAPAAVVEAHPTSGTVKRGVNLAGGERGNSTGNDPQRQALLSDFSNTRLGTFGTDYNYGQAGSYAFLAGRGHKVLRLPIRWERVQPTLGAALSATEVGRIKAGIDNAVANGMTVILDIHNYGGYFVEGGSGGVYHDIANSDGIVTQAHFVDLWTRLSAAFSGYTGVYAYDLMNEPNFMQVGASGWETIAQAAVTAIRGAGDTTLIQVPLYQGTAGQYTSGMGSAGNNHPSGPWITDSASKIQYEAHYYPDPTANFTTPYAAQVGTAGLTYNGAIVPGAAVGRPVNRRRPRAWLSETFAETKAKAWAIQQGATTATAWGVRVQATSGTNARISRTDAKFSDFLAEWTIKLVQGTEARFRFREVDSSNYWNIWLNGSANQVAFQKSVAGSGTTVATTNVTAAQLADGSLQLACRCVGNKLSMFVNGKLITTTTDSFQSTAKIFTFAAFNATTGFAAFELGTLDITPLTGT